MADNGLVPAAPPEAPGAAQYRNMAAQVGQPLADQWKTEQSATMLRSGKFTGGDIDAWWGDDKPKATPQAPVGIPQPHVATNALEAWGAGWDMSVTGLTANLNARNVHVAMGGNDRPMVNTVLPQDATLAEKIVAGTAQTVGDLPFMLGTMRAAPAATGATGAGMAAGGGPEALRQLLITAYNFHPKDGSSPIQTFQDFGAAYSDHLNQIAVATAAGGLGGKAGGLVTEGITAAGGSKVAGTIFGATTMAATATGVTAGMNGKMPDAKDFTSMAILALGFEGAAHMTGGRVELTEAGQRVAANSQKIYVRTGILPQDQVRLAETSPTMRQELLGQDPQGDPVIANINAHATAEPPHFERPPPDPTQPTPAFGRRPNDQVPQAPRPPTMANDVDTAANLLVHLEGGTNPNGTARVSPAGAIGKYQLMPGTARQYWSRVFPGETFEVGKLFDPKVNEAIGRAVITDLFQRYHGNMDAIAIAYNAGPGRANEYMTKGPGTRLLATPDKTVRGGIRYEAEPSSRDESWLPLETQRYLANGRRRSGGEMPGEGGDAGMGHNGGPVFDAAARPGGANDEAVAQEERATGTGLEEGGGDLSSASTWRGASVDALATELNSNIGEQPQPKSIWNIDRIITDLFSELQPARQVDDALIQNGLYNRMSDMGLEDHLRQTYASDNRAATFARYGIVDPVTKDVSGPSLFDAVKEMRDAGGTPDGWRAYMNARRTVEQQDRGIESGFNPFAAAEMVRNTEANTTYGKATETWNKVMDGVLNYTQKSGLHSEKQIEAMKAANPTYVSWRRITGDDSPFPSAGRGPAKGPRDPFYRMEGSDKQIVDPLAATVDNIRVAIANADRNTARLWLVDRALADPKFATVIGFKTEAGADPNETDVDNALKSYGFTDDQLPAARTAYESLVQMRQDANLRDTEFAYYRDGQRMVAEINNPIIAKLLRSTTTPAEANVIMRTFQFFAAVERTGIASTPDYGPSVGVFHQFNQFIQDPLHPPPFMAPLRGIMHVLRADDVYQDVIAKGGLGAAMVGLDRDSITGELDNVFTSTGTWDRVWNAVQNPKDFATAVLHAAQLVNEKIDAANRVGYNLMARDRGIEPIKAATMGRKAGIDYHEMAGAQVINGLAKIAPFFRAHLLGMKQGWESFAEQGDGKSRAQNIAATLTAATLAVALPKIALYVLNRDQDKSLPEGQRYQDIPQWERDHYYITPEIGGTRIKLRMPANFGFAFGTLPERAMNAIYDHAGPDAFRELMSPFMQEYVPTPNIPMLQAPAEVAANYNFFTGHALIPDSVRQRSPELQYTENTTAPAIALAKVIGQGSLGTVRPSPMQIEHLVNGWFGTMGMQALKAIDAPFRPAQPEDLADNLFVRGFVVRHPGMSSQPIADFYTRYQDFTQAKGDFGFLKKQAVINGQTTIDTSQLDTAEAAAAGGLAKIPKALSDQRTLILEVTHNEHMTVDEKRQAIDNLYSQSVVMAAYGSAVMDTVRDRHLSPEQRQDFIVQETTKFYQRYGELQAAAPPIPRPGQ